jgi:hypothetical protein
MDKCCATLVLRPGFLYAIRYWFFRFVSTSGNGSVSRLKVRTLIREVHSDPNQLTQLSVTGRGQGFDDFRSKGLKSDALLMQTRSGIAHTLSLSSQQALARNRYDDRIQ